MRVALVDTIPKDARNRGSVNLGYELVADKLGADKVHWSDTLAGAYDTLAFNVFYPTHALNIAPFLLANGIEPRCCARSGGPRLIAGGQGVGRNGLLSGVMDEVFVGEYDYTENVVSRPCIKCGKAVIELTRGCRYRCKFCQYGWVDGGDYREKDIALVKEQINFVTSRGVRNINFLSANYAGYSHLAELLDYAMRKNVYILNSDACLRDIHNLYGHPYLLSKCVKIGVETFSEQARTRIGKPISDAQLWEVVEKLADTCGNVHFYLIYGLPGDDYAAWFGWVRRLGALRRRHTREYADLFNGTMRENTRNIRIEFSITNFEPCAGTPLADAPRVDFKQKEEFLAEWFAVLKEAGFIKSSGRDYKNARGRIGRKELSYNMLMSLKTGGAELTEKLVGTFKAGVGRSISDAEAARFLA